MIRFHIMLLIADSVIFSSTFFNCTSIIWVCTRRVEHCYNYGCTRQHPQTLSWSIVSTTRGKSRQGRRFGWNILTNSSCWSSGHGENFHMLILTLNNYISGLIAIDCTTGGYNVQALWNIGAVMAVFGKYLWIMYSASVINTISRSPQSRKFKLTVLSPTTSI